MVFILNAKHAVTRMQLEFTSSAYPFLLIPLVHIASEECTSRFDEQHCVLLQQATGCCVFNIGSIRCVGATYAGLLSSKSISGLVPLDRRDVQCRTGYNVAGWP